MNWVQAEKEIYNKALKAVEKTNQSLIRVYLITQKEIEQQLKQFYLTVDPLWSKQYQAQRLTAIFKSINKRLTVLTGITTDTIEKAFLREYRDTFYSYAYNLSGYYSTAQAFTILPFSINSESVILAALNEKVGEYSFLKSMKSKQSELRESLREATAISISKGESPFKLAKRLKEQFDTGISRYVATARTEMLKIYSIAQEEVTRQAMDLGIDFSFQWLAASDTRTRHSHAIMNGKFAKKFKKDGTPIFYVGASKGSAPRLLTGRDQAAQNINCRCRRLNIPMKMTDEQKSKFETTNLRPTSEMYVEMIS